MTVPTNFHQPLLCTKTVPCACLWECPEHGGALRETPARPRSEAGRAETVHHSRAQSRALCSSGPAAPCPRAAEHAVFRGLSFLWRGQALASCLRTREAPGVVRGSAFRKAAGPGRASDQSQLEASTAPSWLCSLRQVPAPRWDSVFPPLEEGHDAFLRGGQVRGECSVPSSTEQTASGSCCHTPHFSRPRARRRGHGGAFRMLWVRKQHVLYLWKSSSTTLWVLGAWSSRDAPPVAPW